jgi:DNA-binding beta-propeller fold protein YncE
VGSQALGAQPKYTLFESGQVRPLALSPDGSRLFAVNTPDARLEIFDIKSSGLKLVGSVPVGLEPVAVAARTNDEVWVVNHLSDSVSIVEVTQNKPRVVRTLLVGDEPRDIVFAGPGRTRAFITTAHRGQNSPIDPQLTTPGVGRADVWVFDAANLGTTLGGVPLGILTLFSDTPRALAVNADGSRVYAAAFASGNRTTTVHRDMVPDGGEDAGGRPLPNVNHQGDPERNVGLIVQFNGQHWVDTIGRSWDDEVAFSLPDKDVFVIDALANPPQQVDGPSGFYAGVGTMLFNMIVNPVNGKVYVSNTDARNDVRFSGPADYARSVLEPLGRSGPFSVQGHLVDSRITVLDGSTVKPRYLNKHIDYSQCCGEVPGENAKSLAFPLDMAITEDGRTLYVTALGSEKIGVFDTEALEQDTFTPDAANQITLSAGGPTGLALDETRHRLYALTRFDNGISIVDTEARTEIGHVTLFNPEPASVVNGRRFLYDASFSSSHGDSACASCHVFADLDHIAWDLGNPDGDVVESPGPFFRLPFGDDNKFHPMKGPMATQSLRGMANHGAMHWRGDRTGGFNEPSAQPDQGTFNEVAAFKQFNEAFVSLNGRATEITDEEMQAFADFTLQVTYPPNPIRALDSSRTLDQQIGKDVFENAPRTLSGLEGFQDLTCGECHAVNPNFNAEFGVPAPGLFGGTGLYEPGDAGQIFKIPHLRNLYQKVGMFGMISNPFANPFDSGAFMGDQIRGFGFTHDGAMDTIFRFHGQLGFIEDPILNPTGFARDEAGILERRQIESFVLAFDSNLAPIVGQQVTLTSANGGVAGPRIDLLLARAGVGECEVVVSGRVHQTAKGYLYNNGVFWPDKSSEAPLTDSALRQLAAEAGQELTYTCVPNGSGHRMALDRDLDGVLNRNEEDQQ